MAVISVTCSQPLGLKDPPSLLSQKCLALWSLIVTDLEVAGSKAQEHASNTESLVEARSGRGWGQEHEAEASSYEAKANSHEAEAKIA